VTAKEQLLERVRVLSEAEAAEALVCSTRGTIR
jgi:hypothetical protein